MSKKKSFVWLYFEKKGDKARCKVNKCNKLLASGNGTSNLAAHLKRVHGNIETIKASPIADTNQGHSSPAFATGSPIANSPATATASSPSVSTSTVQVLNLFRQNAREPSTIVLNLRASREQLRVLQRKMVSRSDKSLDPTTFANH